jgi:hypothetical protein
MPVGVGLLAALVLGLAFTNGGNDISKGIAAENVCCGGQSGSTTPGCM